MRFTNKKHATFKLCGARVIILGIVVKARAMSCLARARYFIGTRLFLKKHATSKNCLQVNVLPRVAQSMSGSAESMLIDLNDAHVRPTQVFEHLRL
jgi:hypothetical protein